MTGNAAPQPPTRTILLVEDEEPVRDVTRHVLESAGYLVLEAASAEQAFAAFQHFDGAIDLLLTDVVMPSMSGSELAARLQALRPGLATLFMSGYSGRAGLPQATPGSLNHFIQKPFSVSLLLARVSEAVTLAIPPHQPRLGAQLPI
jgi:two-component system cell cycle sensor histidine kinase/response regulator CckA